MRLLDIRAFELKSAVHDVFDHVWKALIHVDMDSGILSISQTSESSRHPAICCQFLPANSVDQLNL